MRGCRPGKVVQMSEAEVRGLCIKSREIFLSQPILLELEAPLKICGENCNCQQPPFFVSIYTPGQGAEKMHSVNDKTWFVRPC